MSERRRVHQRVRRGEAAWDERSARYAVEVARATERTPTLFGPRANRVLLWLLPVGSAWTAVDEWSDGRWLAGLLYAIGAVALSVIAIFSPAWLANAPRARAANQALLVGAEPVARQVVPPSRAQERVGFVLAVVLMAMLFGGGFVVADGDVTGGLLSGLLFGIVFVPAMRVIGRRAHEARADDAAPVTPIAPQLWSRVAPRVRTALRVLGATVAALFIWLLAMVSTQLPTCDTSEGGIASGDQVGLTKAFCGTPGADVAGVVLVFGLVAAVPIAGLVLAVFAAERRTGRARLTLLGIGALLVALGPVVAWLLAGAH